MQTSGIPDNGHSSFLRHAPRSSTVMDILAASKHPLSARDVFQILALQGRKASLSTVYRTIQRLHYYGQVVRAMDDPSQEATYSVRRRFDTDFSVRVQCRHCLREWNINDQAVARELERLVAELTSGSADVRTEIQMSCVRCLPPI
jgi:Fe2+ or Zn2+ uptake regulation protein